MLRTLRNLVRLLHIARTLARHDALFPLEQLGVASGLVGAARLVWRRGADRGKRPGERLAAAFEELGPSFIKLGQALATRPDLIPIDLKRQGLSIQLSEQNLHFSTLVSDRAYIIEKGRIRYEGTMEELAKDEDVRAAYLTI